MGNDFVKKQTIAVSLALALAVSPALADSVDALSLFRDMTQSKSQLEVRTGEPTQFSSSEKTCITSICADGGTQCTPTGNDQGSPLLSGSDHEKYYALSMGSDGYPRYGEHSQYARDVAALTANMDRLMTSFQRTGLRRELKRRGMTPALMFDLDNTLEFSAAPDSDPKGDGPAIQGLVDFAKRWCFKDGLACYFITARNCDESSVIPTEKWLQANFKLDEQKIRRYTHFSRNTQNLTCSIPGNPTVAYKDVIREALEQKEKVFWLMSVGDQLTDSLGEHSGMKIRVPNQFFHSDIVANQNAPWGVGQCGSPQTIAPPRDCAEKLRDHAIEYSSLDYCRKQKH